LGSTRKETAVSSETDSLRELVEKTKSLFEPEGDRDTYLWNVPDDTEIDGVDEYEEEARWKADRTGVTPEEWEVYEERWTGPMDTTRGIALQMLGDDEGELAKGIVDILNTLELGRLQRELPDSESTEDWRPIVKSYGQILGPAPEAPFSTQKALLGRVQLLKDGHALGKSRAPQFVALIAAALNLYER